MAGIGHIKSVYNPELKKVSSKLSFQVGDTLSARVINSSEDDGEVILKLSDGWQFSAKVEKPIDFPLRGQLKFQIVGQEDGKLILKLIDSNSKGLNSELDSLVNILNENSLSSDEYALLEKMLKHNIVLNKDNISMVKSLVDFMSKISSANFDEDIFIDKYILNKGITESSEKGIKIKDALKSFITQLKSIEIDDLLMMIENNIEIDTENVESFKRVFKEEMGLYNSLTKTEQLLQRELPNGLERISKSTLINQKGIEEVTDSNTRIENEFGKAANKSSVENIMPQYNSKSIYEKPMSKLEILKSFIGERQEIKNLVKDIIVIESEEFSVGTVKKMENILDQSNDGDIRGNLVGFFKNELSFSEVALKTLENTFVKIKEQDIVNIIKGIIEEKNIVKGNDNNFVHSEISSKIDEMKTVIKNMFNVNNGLEAKTFDNIVEALKPTINDLKVFNTMSNQYYYMDVPVNIKESEYPCKLIIKDDRSKGKKIDSKNVSMVVSIRTGNMDTVDSFIKVRDKNMDIEIKCEEQWINILESKKSKLVDNLSALGYRLNISFLKRVKEIDIISCREFFNDSSFNTINTKV